MSAPTEVVVLLVNGLFRAVYESFDAAAAAHLHLRFDRFGETDTTRFAIDRAAIPPDGYQLDRVVVRGSGERVGA